MAGPNQGKENPLGEGGMGLHEWAFKLSSFDGLETGVGFELTDVVRGREALHLTYRFGP